MTNHQKILWIASGNPSKAKELIYFVQKLFPEFSLIKARSAKDVNEGASTFLGNAKIKAQALAEELIAESINEFYVLGDDSGLCVDALNGKPGLYSRRFAGPHATSEENTEKVLRDLSGIDLPKQRSAQYYCALCLLRVSGGVIAKESLAEGQCQGQILKSPRGSHGFAYDCIFLRLETNKTFAELSFEEKQKTSHRMKAFTHLREAAEAGSIFT